MAKNTLLDPLIIAQLGNLQLRAHRILDGLYSGHHINLNRGHAQDFSQHRPYNPGDDPRTLDWKVFGRTDRLVVRQYEEQTNIGAIVIVDDSASMGFSWGENISKLEYVKTMAAAMGYLIVSQHDAVGLLSTRSQLSPGTHRAHLDRFFDVLENIQPKGVWDFQDLGGSLGAGIKKKSIVVVFSDLMAGPERVITSIMSLHARKHDVMVFQVLDPAEIDLPFEGPILFEDMETGEKLNTEPEFFREKYKESVQRRIHSFEHVFQSAGVDFQVLPTNVPFDKGLGAFLSWRGVRL